jgi:hypothetical protein
MFYGEVKYKKHVGEKPMSVTWQLMSNNDK